MLIFRFFNGTEFFSNQVSACLMRRKRVLLIVAFWVRGTMDVLTKSLFVSVNNNPNVEKSPAIGGMMMCLMDIFSASSVACRGPAPPNAIRMKSRGSCPRATEIRRRMRSMLALATDSMPQAAFFRGIFKGLQICRLIASSECSG